MDFVSKASEELGADDRSEVCDDIVRNYVDEYASFFILCAFSKRLHEPFSYGDLYNPELEDYINFQETLELWEDEEAEDSMVFSIIVLIVLENSPISHKSSITIYGKRIL